MKITFTDTVGIIEDYYPTPASTNLPDWYKELPSYTSATKRVNYQNTQNGTAKRCMPMFDMLCSGYLIYSFVDIFVSKVKTVTNGKEEITSHFQWPTTTFKKLSNLNPIEFHLKNQLPNYFKPTEDVVPKFVNPWGIKTPPGYSCLVSNPRGRDLPFTIFEGIVDTDTYSLPILLPFLLNDVNFEGLIPAGTPIAQILPFKRDSWEMSMGSDKDDKKIIDDAVRLKAKFFDSYKNQFRQTKRYK